MTLTNATRSKKKNVLLLFHKKAGRQFADSRLVDPGRKVMGAMAGKRLAYFRLSVSLAIISLSTFTRSYSVFF